MGASRAEILRLVQIHTLVSSHSYPSKQQLADRLEVSESTIKRDLDALRHELNAPLEYDRARHGYYYSEPFHLGPEPLSEHELQSLTVLLSLVESLRLIPLKDAMQRALSKVRSCAEPAVPNEHVSLLGEYEPPEQAHVGGYSSLLLKAIMQKRQVWVRYYTLSTDQISERVLDPYHLYYLNGLWYLYAYCHKRRERRDFALVRIQELRMLDTHFEPPDRAEIIATLRERFTNLTDGVHTVRVRFHGAAARRIHERQWHHTQRVIQEGNGSLVLEMECGGLESIKRWILGFGVDAMPLAPAALVEMYQEEVRRMYQAISPK